MQFEANVEGKLKFDKIKDISEMRKTELSRYTLRKRLLSCFWQSLKTVGSWWEAYLEACQTSMLRLFLQK